MSLKQRNGVRNHLREQMEPKFNSRPEWLIHLLTQVVLTSLLSALAASA